MSAAGTPVDRSAPPQPGSLRPFHFPPTEQATLGNGMQLRFAASPGLGVATAALLLRASAVAEPAERAGLATLTASLLESGTRSRSAAEIADAFERLGVQVGVGAAWNATQLEVTGLASRLPAALELVAELVRSPAFPELEVERLRQEQLASILQRRAEPRGLADEMAARYIFAPASPFSRAVVGTAGTVGGLTRSDVEAFHAGHYSPVGATLVVTGDLDFAAASGLAESAFGSWSAAPAPEPATEIAARFQRRRVVLIDRPGAVQSEIRIGHVGVARSTPDYFPLVVMNAILGGAFSSRLNLSLREKHGFTYGATSAFVMRRHPGPFLVSTAVQTEVTAAAVREAFRELEGIREGQVSAAELADARNYLAGIFPLRLQTTEGLASRLAELALYDLPADYFDHYRDRILAVTAEEVHQVAQRRIDPERAVVLVVGDAAAVRPGLEELGLGETEVVAAGEVE